MAAPHRLGGSAWHTNAFAFALRRLDILNATQSDRYDSDGTRRFSVTAPIIESAGSDDPSPAGPDRSHARHVMIVIIAGLAALAIVVVGAVVLFDPFASAAGSCGGG